MAEAIAEEEVPLIPEAPPDEEITGGGFAETSFTNPVYDDDPEFLDSEREISRRHIDEANRLGRRLNENDTKRIFREKVINKIRNGQDPIVASSFADTSLSLLSNGYRMTPYEVDNETIKVVLRDFVKRANRKVIDDEGIERLSSNMSFVMKSNGDLTSDIQIKTLLPSGARSTSVNTTVLQFDEINGICRFRKDYPSSSGDNQRTPDDFKERINNMRDEIEMSSGFTNQIPANLQEAISSNITREDVVGVVGEEMTSDIDAAIRIGNETGDTEYLREQSARLRTLIDPSATGSEFSEATDEPNAEPDVDKSALESTRLEVVEETADRLDEIATDIETNNEIQRDASRLTRFKEWIKDNPIGITAIGIALAGTIATIVMACRQGITSAAKGTSALAKAVYNLGKKLFPLLAPVFTLLAKVISWGAKGLLWLSQNLWILFVGAVLLLYTWYKNRNKKN